MNSTPIANRFQIGIFGKTNSGKSSLINAITNQKISIVSEKKGTTTDPVFKAMEIPLIGACVLVDTPGFDDTEKEIGKIRVKKSFEILEYVDACIFVLEKGKNLNKIEKNFLEKIKNKNIPTILVINKCDLKMKEEKQEKIPENMPILEVSAKEKQNIDELIKLMSKNFSQKEKESFLISDLISEKDLIILIIAIDEAYPKARLILPQQQLINEILQKGAICKIVKDSEYGYLIENMKEKPKLIVTDSQIFSQVFEKTPKNLLVTSFSILLAKKAKILKTAVEGTKAIEKIKDDDKILICESCTHKKKGCDIGSVKIPKLIEQKTQKKPKFEFLTGVDFEKNLQKYKLVIHCGGCMIPTKKITNRFNLCKKLKIPITNYGVLIAYLNDVLEKSLLFLKKLKTKN